MIEMNFLIIDKQMEVKLVTILFEVNLSFFANTPFKFTSYVLVLASNQNKTYFFLKLIIIKAYKLDYQICHENF